MSATSWGEIGGAPELRRGVVGALISTVVWSGRSAGEGHSAGFRF